MADEFRFRPVRLDDADLLLEWRNDPATRKSSHTTSEILEEEHLHWLEKLLTDSERQQYVYEEDGSPVGTVRADFSNGIHELSWIVAPFARGRGVGKRMLSRFAAQISGPIRAEVKVRNKASIKLAEYAGMKLVKEENGIMHFMRSSHQS